MTISGQNKNEKAPSVLERTVSIFLLGVILLIGAVILVVQSRFDPGVWRARPDNVKEPSPVLLAGEASATAGLQHLSPPETYDAETLSDKIDGKAELYLSAGFKKLVAQRFAPAPGAGQWMERYVYDMGEYGNAYAVFSAQRRPNSQSVALTDSAYHSANGLFFIHGRYYVEIIASAVSETLQAKMMDLARNFVASVKVEKQALVEIGLFPKSHRVENSVALVAENVLGIDGFNHIFTAQYRWDGDEALAFVSRRDSPAQAVALAAVFVDFFMEYGGNETEPPKEYSGFRTIAILDTYEIIATQGPYLFGVHEATSLSSGLTLARELQKVIQEAGNESKSIE